MKKYLLFIFVLLMFVQPFQLRAQDYYWVAFTDKNKSGFSLSTPKEYLSERALQRRTNQGITIDSLDLPVNTNYVSRVAELGCQVLHTSKWLNGMTVKTDTVDFAQRANALDFVKFVQLTKPGATRKSAINKFMDFEHGGYAPIDTSVYGPSVFQTGIMNGQFLHNQNFRGQGMQMAILDGGFYKVDEYAAFDSLWANNQILGTKDFVDPGSDIFSTHDHGASVLSCIGGNVPGQLIGTAPKASFWLLRSEDTGSEYLIEEDNWVAAAEFADSVGVDIINSSLGYYEFDDPAMDHTYAEMDGNTTRVTRGANIAASRGILVFSSAGNQGRDTASWHQIIAPSDGHGVVGVGAVGRDSVPASFTSHGPASDGAVKPNVAALGQNAFLQKKNGILGYSSGTSFSSPIMAGMAACLWQSSPGALPGEVKTVIEMSAHLYENPDSLQGFGIPDFEKAFVYLINRNAPQIERDNRWTVFPNPVGDYIVLQQEYDGRHQNVVVEIYSLEGRLLRMWEKPAAPTLQVQGLHSLPNGFLLLKITSANHSETFKLSKTR